MRGLAASALAVVLLSAGTVGVSPALAGGAARPVQCSSVSREPSPLPAWTADANPPRGIPHVLSQQRNVAAVLFGDPLTAPARADRNNKILWIVRAPRDGHALRLTARPAKSTTPVVRLVVPADSSPGEIYPSIVDVPKPGCWHFVLEWSGHRATINLAYRSEHEPTPTTTTAVSWKQVDDHRAKRR